MTTEERRTEREIVAALERRRGFTTHSIKATLRAVEMLGLAVAGAAAKARTSRDPLAQLYGPIIEGNVRADWFEAMAVILQGRIGRVPPRHRPHYAPAERYSIIMLMKLHGKTVEEMADAFQVSEQTITRWMDEATKEPDKKGVCCEPGRH